ncbi:HNH endonuclease signature motif containing protein [Mesoflavibacter profundi]|uniref:HNH endonuclease signature motif containing protein n=1 Tax=Mesoflavibacter profundi TaxID=2708110 RepID=UPI003512FE36
MSKKIIFSKSQHQFIVDNYLKLSSMDLSKHLGCSRSVVSNYLRDNGLKMPKAIQIKLRSEKLKGRTTFTPEMDAYLKANYLTKPLKSIGKHIGKSYTGITVRLRQLGLEVPREIIEANKQKSQFKKGHISHNKGKTLDDFMTPEQKQQFLKTSFKKGQQPHNTKQPGYQRYTPDGYIEVRVKEGGFMLKHRLIYEKLKGAIPKGYNVVFKDGDKRNFNIDNLECISSGELMRRNSISNYPPVLRQSMRLIKQLNKEL